MIYKFSIRSIRQRGKSKFSKVTEQVDCNDLIDARFKAKRMAFKKKADVKYWGVDDRKYYYRPSQNYVDSLEI